MDNYNLKFLIDQRISTIPQHKWASKLHGFDFRPEYKSNTANVVADTLSWRDTELQAVAFTILAPSYKVFDKLRLEFASEPTLEALCQEIWDGLRGDKWAMVDDLVTCYGRIFILTSSPRLMEILASVHVWVMKVY
jgi:hypothetical protein